MSFSLNAHTCDALEEKKLYTVWKILAKIINNLLMLLYVLVAVPDGSERL